MRTPPGEQHPRRAGSISRGALLGLVAAAVLLAQLGRTLLAGGGGEVAATAAAHRERARRIPLEEFRHDASNRVEGTLVTEGGLPVADAEVLVFDRRTLAAECAATPPGTWPDPVPGATARSDERGRFVLREVPHGNKCVVVRASGYHPVPSLDVIHIDGIECEIDVVLTPAEPLRLRLRELDGAPLAGAPVRALPGTFGARPVELQSDAEGFVTVPPDCLPADGALSMLAGAPPVLVSVRAERSDDAPHGEPVWPEELELPPACALELTLGGIEDGPVELELYPEGALRAGRTAMELEVTGGRARIPALRAGRYGLLMRRGERSAWAWIEHPAAAVALELRAPARVDLRVVGDGADGPAPAAHGSVMWEPDPPAPRRWLPGAPHEWLDTVPAVHRWVHLDEQGHAPALELPGASGRLTAEAGAGWAPARAPVPPDGGELELWLPPARKVYIEGSRPYLPVVIELGQVTVTGVCSPHGEATCWAPDGPLIARTGFPRGGRSRPKGTWIGDDDEPEMRFTRLDEHAPSRGLIHGFVLDGVGARARVVRLDRRVEDGEEEERPRFTPSGDDGYYQLADLAPGRYSLSFAAKAGGESLGPELELDVPAQERGAVLRVDLASAPGTLILRPPEDGRLELRDATGATRWERTLDGAAEIELTDLEPDNYELAVYPAQAGTPRLVPVTIGPGDEPARVDLREEQP